MEGPHGPAAHDRGDWPRTGATDPDDLLRELRARAQASSRSQQRLGALLDAVMAITAGLDLPEVLTRIVDCACDLVDARYGALGVLGTAGDGLVQFVTHGLTANERDAIGPLPRGHGVLGLLIREPQPLRLETLADHPASQGFPPNHPAMGSFMGTPVRVGDQIFGNLYLTEKIGGSSFTAEDEGVAVALAAAAGIAIDNARLYERTRRQREWMEAAGEVGQMLLEGHDESSAMAYLASRVRVLSRAELAVVALRDDIGDLVVRAADSGGLGEPSSGSSPPGVGTALQDPGWQHLFAGRAPLLVPIVLGADPIGTLAVGWARDAEPVVGEPAELLAPLAHQVALALVAARNQHARARVALLEDRDRIARDMHDHVIQRLFATGLSLQATARLPVTDAVRTRLDDAVEALDEAIKDIRHTIFELHREIDPADLRAEVTDLVRAAGDGLGFVPQLTVTGSLSSLPSELEADVVAVIREAVANVSRHARATSAQVSVVAAAVLTITVSDNGIGVDATATFSGLSNLRVRAESHGGSLRLAPNIPTGTVLTWVATIPEEADG